MGLVRIFVLGEAHVAIDAEQRALGVAAQGRLGLGEPRGKVGHEGGERVADLGFIARFVGEKPGAVVVEAKLAEEGEGVRREAGEGGGWEGFG